MVKKLLLLLTVAVTALTASAVVIDGITYNYGECKGSKTVSGDITIRSTYKDEYGVEHKVYKIFYGAFSQNQNITSVTVEGDNLEIVEGFAFAECSNLKWVKLNKGVKKIEQYAFYKSGIETIDLGNSLTEIGERCFASCESLQSIVMPNTLTTFGMWVFRDCHSLKSVKFPAGLDRIPHGMFISSGLETIVIPEGVTEIYPYAFSYCRNLKEVKLPSTLTLIQYEAFKITTSLEKINFPSSLVRIDNMAFAESGLKEVTFPAKFGYMENAVFKNCKNLEKVIVPPGCQNFLMDETFSGCINIKEIDVRQATMYMSPIKLESTFSKEAYNNATVYIPTFMNTPNWAGLNYWRNFKKVVYVEYPKGDINLDKIVDISDVSTHIDLLLGKENPEQYVRVSDINDDKVTDVNDLNTIINKLLGK